MHNVSQKMYAAQQAATPPPNGAEGGEHHEDEGKPHDENTVEGEFKEV